MTDPGHFRNGDAIGPAYKCSQCGLHGFRLWRKAHHDTDFLCAVCAEQAEAEAIARYADIHNEHDPSIGNMIPARPTPEGDAIWGHTSGDVEWWYRLPQYADEKKEAELVRRERDHFLTRWQGEMADWLKRHREARQIEEENARLQARIDAAVKLTEPDIKEFKAGWRVIGEIREVLQS